MRIRFVAIVLTAALAGGLAGCGAGDRVATSSPETGSGLDAQASATAGDAAPDLAAGQLAAPAPASASEDDLGLGKQYFSAGNFSLAERHFRSATAASPNDSEAWIGLAATYDKQKRFDLADRAYADALKITGPTAELLNNQGYSYMLRGDFSRAREKLDAARRLAPDNRYVRNNLKLLAEREKSRKAAAR